MKIRFGEGDDAIEIESAILDGPLVQVVLGEDSSLTRFPGMASVPVVAENKRAMLAAIACVHADLGEEIVRLYRELDEQEGLSPEG